MSEQENHQVIVPVRMPVNLAGVLSQKVQFLYSERMQAELMKVLTPEQLQTLARKGVEARPVVFPSQVINA